MAHSIGREISANTGWFTDTDLTTMIAVSESTPGPIGVNMATYAGIQTAGILGGITATFALVLPSVIIIILVAMLLKKFQQNPYVISAMSVLRPTSVGLIAAAFYSVIKVSLLRVDNYGGNLLQLFNLPAIGLCAVLVFITWRFKKLHPIALVFIGAAAGVLLKL